ncbi:P-loop containing nucleoside triphosphate hydrolase protein [Lipomyces arxii]|uniref:P-loop containing nucleoside triphosphate hydrolase protein n=1 Tax=Lipomyces arxii TaxID=56418 RepID=UPI0034CDF8E4
MPNFACPGPVWMTTDFSPCAQYLYFHIYVPLFCLMVSATVVFTFHPVLALIKTRRGGQVALEGDDELMAGESENLVRLRTNDPSSMDFAPESQLNTGNDDDAFFAGVENLNEDPEFNDLVHLSPHGARARQTVERGCLSMLLVVHFVVLAVSLVRSGSESKSQLVLQSLTSLALWSYCVFLASFRDVQLHKGVSVASAGHLAAIYVLEFVCTVIQFRSLWFTSYSKLVSTSVVFDMILLLVLSIVALQSPLGALPPYTMVPKGLKVDVEIPASIYAHLTYGWVFPLMWLGYRKPLIASDMWDVSNFRCSNVVNEHGHARENESVMRWLFRSFSGDMTLATIWTVFAAVMTFTPTLLLKLILQYIENPAGTPAHIAWMYVVLMFVCSAINSVATLQSFHLFNKMSVKMRALLICTVYGKALRRKHVAVADESATESKEKSANETEAGGDGPEVNMGSVINLMSSDAISIADAIGFLQNVIRAILLVTLSLSLLYSTLGSSAFAGTLTMIAILPINGWIAKDFSERQVILMERQDERITKINEMMQSIKVIKFFAWEPMFKKRIMGVRAQELAVLTQQYIRWALGSFVFGGLPYMVTFVSFGAYTVLAKRELTASVAFSSLALFNLMRAPMDTFPEALSRILDLRVSLIRIQRFVNETSTDKYRQLNQTRGPESPYIGFENTTVTWGDDASSKMFRLPNLNIDFAVGELTVIIGPTGCGKTSLLMALLGEMTVLEGNVFLPGVATSHKHRVDPATGLSETVAYCAQQAWLLNDSIRENILFGQPYEQKRYEACVRACALARDLEILESGDQTIVGERGIALSGGQKQRISIARALYSPSRHILMDDPLSAVDSHSASWIYKKCITGPLMEGRTCLLVTHNVALTVTGAHSIVAMKDGLVKFHGSPEDAFNQGFLGDDDLLKSSLSSRNQSRSVSRVQSSASMHGVTEPTTMARARVTDEVEISRDVLEAEDVEEHRIRSDILPVARTEAVEVGDVKFAHYLRYLRAMGKSLYFLSLSVVFLSYEGSVLFQAWWIREWTGAQPDTEVQARASAHGVGYYLGFYGLISLSSMVLVVMRDGVVFWGSLTASVRIFNNLLGHVTGAKMRFFDTTPVGRIMNRFSRDISLIDQDMALELSVFSSLFVSLVAVVGLIGFIVPMFLVPGVFIFALFFGINELYLRPSRELKRIEAVTRSPIFQYFGETLAGLSTIRAYAHERRFMVSIMSVVDSNTRPYFLNWVCNRWMNVRVEFVSGFVASLIGGFLLMNLDTVDAGLAGLCLTYAISFTEKVYELISVYTLNELNMNSVERIEEYVALEQEDIDSGVEPPSEWPERGEIVVENLSLRYAPELPLVISGVSFKVEPGWKVGVVGRTGAGKSTIASAFFRFMEFDSGRIVIDGVDISTLELKDVRQALTIIPQDPTLFTGSLRSNLDPFEEYSDAKIFESLRRVHLIDRADEGAASSENPDANINVFYNLDSSISEGGLNLSQGQRQLVCLARSLLKSPKVIMLDEATASIDYDTDALLQQTIRQELAHTTILTIAHRLRSIIDYDAILVLDAGTVKEYDKPHVLLQRPDSIFRAMCEKSGELATLEELAVQAYAR